MWEITVGNDPDTTGEKTITGVWREADGTVFTFSERVPESVFNIHAVAARNAWREKMANDKVVSDALTASINANDPEVL